MNRFCSCAVVAAVVVVGPGCGDTAGAGATPIEGLVCGVDGKTYSVEEAAKEEHEISHRGRCDEPMHCESPNDCFVGDDCEPPVVNDLEIAPTGPQASWCIPGLTRCNCPGVFEPVCGGDGRNYINRCEAACAGVGVRQEGFCEEPPGRGCARAGCSGQLCVDEGVDIASTCEWRPVYVCYQEATCDRQPNGQCGFTPTHELVECLEKLGPVCALIDCAPGYVCELGQCVPPVGLCNDDRECPVGWICLRGILANPLYDGICERCACQEIYAPVCGVDGHTYGNACEARCAHVEVAYSGECNDDCPVMTHVRTPDGRCEPKCYGPEQCGDEQYCNAPDVCLQDPACPQCDVCVGWCELAEFDCRTQGCGEGDYCTFCWVGFACIPEGAVC